MIFFSLFLPASLYSSEGGLWNKISGFFGSSPNVSSSAPSSSASQSLSETYLLNLNPDNFKVGTTNPAKPGSLVTLTTGEAANILWLVCGKIAIDLKRNKKQTTRYFQVNSNQTVIPISAPQPPIVWRVFANNKVSFGQEWVENQSQPDSAAQTESNNSKPLHVIMAQISIGGNNENKE